MINAYSTDRIVRHIAGTIDEWSEPGNEKTEEVRCHIVYKTKLVYNANGMEVSSPLQILTSREQAFDHKDRVELEGEGFTHPIINIIKRRHLAIEFMEIFLEPGTGRTE